MVGHFVGGRPDRCHRLHPRAGLTGRASGRGPSASHCVPMGRSGTGACPPSMNYVFDAARTCEQLQRHLPLRGADTITDHGAENADTAQRTSTEIFLRPLVSLFLSISFLFFLIASKKEKYISMRIYVFVRFGGSCGISNLPQPSTLAEP